MTAPEPELVVHPLTPDRWPAFAELVDQGGPAARCWCMYWRVGAEYRRRPAGRNRADFRAVVGSGPPPGLLAFPADAPDTAIGWCQVTPRLEVPGLDQAWRLRRIDDLPVWAITCFYVRKGHRRRGVMSALIRAAVERATAAGAPALEAYPLDGAVSPSATSTGYVSAFVDAGFLEVVLRSRERPIMRFPITAGPA